MQRLALLLSVIGVFSLTYTDQAVGQSVPLYVPEPPLEPCVHSFELACIQTPRIQQYIRQYKMECWSYLNKNVELTPLKGGPYQNRNLPNEINRKEKEFNEKWQYSELKNFLASRLDENDLKSKKPYYGCN